MQRQESEPAGSDMRKRRRTPDVYENTYGNLGEVRLAQDGREPGGRATEEYKSRNRRG